MNFEVVYNFYVDVEHLAKSFIYNHLEQMLEGELGITQAEMEAIDFGKLARAVANEMLELTKGEEN